MNSIFFIYTHTENLWKHNHYERILEKFKIEENLYIELVAYPK